MKDFSLYDLALKLSQSTEVADLDSVSYISRRDFDERETFTFKAQVPCLEYLSLLIESAVLLRSKRAGRVYVSFEKLSAIECVVDRYLRIGDLSERVYIFGEPDWTPPRHPNIKIYPLPKDSLLTSEWIVIVDSPGLRVALIARDDDGDDAPSPEARNFRAFKTSNPEIVMRLAAAIEGLIYSSLAA